MLKKIILTLLFCPLLAFAQQKDEEIIRKIYDDALTSRASYQWLEYLSNTIGSRLSGTPAAEKAVVFTKKMLDSLGLDRVFLQEVMVPHWVRGKKESAKMLIGKEKTVMNVCALGNSVATGAKGVRAEVIEIQSFEEMALIPKEKLNGKIVFYNVAMDDKHVSTFTAYGLSGKYRRKGASEAIKYGAVGVIVRSLTTALDDYPHTGSILYDENTKPLPAVAISTIGANLLSKKLKESAKTGKKVEFYFETFCEMLPDVLSHNVIGEIKGSEKPEEIILVGGHLDSWDLGDGSHDDGAGVVQSMEVLRLFKKNNIKPKRTIRAVLFMNEENGLRGGNKYAELAKKLNEKHLVAIESDAGGFTPRGFDIDAEDDKIEKIKKYQPLLAQYGIEQIKKGGSGADIAPLKPQNVILIGFRPDSQRYFDYHHTSTDTFDKVNIRELALGSAGIASLVFLLDKYL